MTIICGDGSVSTVWYEPQVQGPHTLYITVLRLSIHSLGLAASASVHTAELSAVTAVD